MIWSAFILGFLGSLHCAGMCGPLALAIPQPNRSPWAMASRSFQYNLGRTSTYTILGLFFGGFGATIRLAGFQSSLSIILGVLMLIMAFFTLDFEKRILRFSALQRFYGMVQIHLGRLLGKNHVSGTFGIGLINGLLPCGLVYAAIFGAISTGNFLDGALFMALFGFGTIPMMFSIAMAGQWMGIQWRTRLRQLIPVFLTLVAVLLIARGLNFDLPYDFRFWQEGQQTPMCH